MASRFKKLPRQVLLRFSDVTRRVSGGNLVYLSIAWVLIIAAALTDEEWAYQYSVVSSSFIVIAMAVTSALKLVLRWRPLIVTPLPLMLGFIALIFGFGPLVHFVDGAEKEVTSWYRFYLSSRDLHRVQVLNLVGLTSLMLGIAFTTSTIHSYVKGSGRKRSSELRSTIEAPFRLMKFSTPTLFRGYLFTLGPSMALHVLKWFAGVDAAEKLPGALNLVEQLGWVAVLFAAVIAARKGGSSWLLLLIPLTLEIAEGALLMRKSKILLPVALAFVGLYLGGKPTRTLLAGAVAVAMAFVAIKPVIDAGRAATWGSQDQSAAEFYSEFLSGNVDVQAEEEKRAYSWWTRLNYTVVQHLLMRLHDADRPGDTYDDLPWMFVPRTLAPDKPVLDVGRRVTLAIFGHESSSTGPTTFGEAYWNGGWVHVLVSLVAAGSIVTLIATTCLWLFFQSDTLSWPIGIMGILIGQRVHNAFTTGIVGSAVVFFCLVALYWVYRQVTSTGPSADHQFPQRGGLAKDRFFRPDASEEA